MQQRYDISMDTETNRLSIKEYTMLEGPRRKHGYTDQTQLEYSLIHEETYDNSVIQAAIDKGRDALIAALRTDSFYPIQSSAEYIAEKVIGVFEKNAEPFDKIYIDDLALLKSNMDD